VTVTFVWTDFSGEELVKQLSLKVQHANRPTPPVASANYVGEWQCYSPADGRGLAIIATTYVYMYVQRIVWNSIPPGDINVVVECHNIPIRPGNLDKQKHSLVYHVKYGP